MNIDFVNLTDVTYPSLDLESVNLTDMTCPFLDLESVHLTDVNEKQNRQTFPHPAAKLEGEG